MLYKELSAEYDAYLSLEQEYQGTSDEFKRMEITKRLYSARETWLNSVAKFRTHLSYLREKNSVVEMKQQFAKAI